MTPCHHLLSVWNSFCQANILDSHLNILLKWAREYADDRDDVYVWWAKIRSKFLTVTAAVRTVLMSGSGA
jgi:hypothetical protein